MTTGELWWLWRHRRGLSLTAACERLKVPRWRLIAAEHDRLDALAACLPPSLLREAATIVPTPAEILRLRRRRSWMTLRACADILGCSHVHFLRLEERGDPAVAAMWDRLEKK